MATVNPPDIERPKKYGRCGEIIHDLDNNMAEHSTAPQVYGVHTSQTPVIPNPLNPRPAIDTVQPMSILQSDGTVKYVLPTQQSIHTDVRIYLQAKFKTIIEMFPPGSICKIHMDDTVAYWTVIHRIELSTTHLEPALYIEFFNLEDIIAMLVETSLSQYPLIQMCSICDPGQIESIDSSEVVEMSRKLIKNEMLDIKRQITALKDNLRQLNRLRNSRDLTSRMVSEIEQEYQALVQSLERMNFTKRPFMGPSLPY